MLRTGCVRIYSFKILVCVKFVLLQYANLQILSLYAYHLMCYPKNDLVQKYTYLVTPYKECSNPLAEIESPKPTVLTGCFATRTGANENVVVPCFQTQTPA